VPAALAFVFGFVQTVYDNYDNMLYFTFVVIHRQVYFRRQAHSKQQTHKDGRKTVIMHLCHKTKYDLTRMRHSYFFTLLTFFTFNSRIFGRPVLMNRSIQVRNFYGIPHSSALGAKSRLSVPLLPAAVYLRTRGIKRQ